MRDLTVSKIKKVEILIFEIEIFCSNHYLFLRWCIQDLTPVLTHFSKNVYDKDSFEKDLNIIFAGHPSVGK